MRSLFDDDVRHATRLRVEKLDVATPGRWGRMTCPQAVCHMADALRGALGELQVDPVDAPFMRYVLRYVALYVPLRWPKGVKAAPEYDQAISGTSPADFAADVAALETLMDRFAESRGRGLAPHPMFGEMTPGEWGRWGFRHMDHHLRQFGV